MREILVVTSAYARTSVHTDSGEGGRGSQDNPAGVENATFSDLKSTTWPLVPRTLDFQYILGMKPLTAHHMKTKRRKGLL